MSAPRARGRPPSRTPAAATNTSSTSAAGAAAASSSSSTAPPGPSTTSRSASATPRPPATSSLLSRGATPTQSMVPSRGAFRGGVRMTFRPVAPVRRKMAESPEIKTEPGTSASATGTPSARGMGRGRGDGGRGRGDGGRGRGRGRGGVPEMVASGPFAMGTGALSRAEARKRAQTSGGAGGGFAPPPGTVSASASGSGLKPESGARSNYRDPDRLREKEEYSDPEDDGVEIVDMEDVRALDELAPSTLPRMKEKEKKKKKKAKEGGGKQGKGKVKAKSEAEDEGETLGGIKDDPEAVESKEREALSGAMAISPTPSDDDDDEDDDKGVRTADALDLSESEEEEIMDDLVDDFVLGGGSDNEADEGASPENRLYLFQFPKLFPSFEPAPVGAGEAESGAGAGAGPVASGSSGGGLATAASGSKPRRSVAFADDTAGGGGMAGSISDTKAGGSSSRDSKEDVKVKLENSDVKPGGSGGRMGPEGQIGRLEVYRDGRVNLRFGKIVLEVTGGSQSTFLQQVMVMDEASRSATTLGEVQRKFVVSPDIQNLLDDARLAEEELREEKRRDEEEEERIAGKGRSGVIGRME